jgi:hypothetical protein
VAGERVVQVHILKGHRFHWDFIDRSPKADFVRLISDKPQIVIPGPRSGTRNLEIEIEKSGFRVLPSRAVPE